MTTPARPAPPGCQTEGTTMDEFAPQHEPPEECPECGTEEFKLDSHADFITHVAPAWRCTGCKWGTRAY